MSCTEQEVLTGVTMNLRNYWKSLGNFESSVSAVRAEGLTNLINHLPTILSLFSPFHFQKVGTIWGLPPRHDKTSRLRTRIAKFFFEFPKLPVDVVKAISNFVESLKLAMENILPMFFE